MKNGQTSCFPNWVQNKGSLFIFLHSSGRVCFIYSYDIYPLQQNPEIFIRPSKTGRIMGSPMAGGRHPLLCPEHISKTILATL